MSTPEGLIPGEGISVSSEASGWVVFTAINWQGARNQEHSLSPIAKQHTYELKILCGPSRPAIDCTGKEADMRE
jgi:hypothetical protein